MKNHSHRRCGCALIVAMVATPAWSQLSTIDSETTSTEYQTTADLTQDLIATVEEYVEIQDLAAMGNGWFANLPSPARDADYPARDPLKEELGKLLFHDKLLSGNMNISCATCHHVLAGTSDGLSLPIGEGAMGLSVTRDTGIAANAVHERVPRNAPAIFNLGAQQFSVIFHDGRVAIDPSQPTGFASPAGNDLPFGLDNVLAVQAMFPVTSATEMAGQPGENAIADAADLGNLAGPGGVWELLAQRLQDPINGYVDLFIDAFADVSVASDITYVHAANAIAAFEAAEWRADDAPFDRYLRSGWIRELSVSAFRGMKLFYGKADCVSCHSGVFQTDEQFHCIGVPQVGPGKGQNAPGQIDGRDDLGREGITGNPADRFRFRTPTLRNIAITGPWGHGGAFNDLEAMVRHHLDPVASLMAYDPAQLILPSRADLDAEDLVVMSDPARVAAIAASVELDPQSLSDQEIADLIAFLREGLTDSRAYDLRGGQPMSVPSGLPVFD